MDKILFSSRLSKIRKAMFPNQSAFAKEYVKQFPPKLRDEAGGNDSNYNGFLGTIKNYENPNHKGKPSLETVDNMCKILGCDVEYLTGRIQEKNHDLQFIHDFTGLEGNAIEELHNYDSNEQMILSHLIMSPRFRILLCKIEQLIIIKNNLLSKRTSVAVDPIDENVQSFLSTLKNTRLSVFEAENEFSRMLEAFTDTQKTIDECEKIKRWLITKARKK